MVFNIYVYTYIQYILYRYYTTVLPMRILGHVAQGLQSSLHQYTLCPAGGSRAPCRTWV